MTYSKSTSQKKVFSSKSTEKTEDIMYDIEQCIVNLFKTSFQGREIILSTDVEEVI